MLYYLHIKKGCENITLRLRYSESLKEFGTYKKSYKIAIIYLDKQKVGSMAQLF